MADFFFLFSVETLGPGLASTTSSPKSDSKGQLPKCVASISVCLLKRVTINIQPYTLFHLLESARDVQDDWAPGVHSAKTRMGQRGWGLNSTFFFVAWEH